MKKEAILKLIAESKPLLSTATPQQKLRLLQLIKEGLKQASQVRPMVLQETEQPSNNDYVAEK
jgi:hypothetical protein